MTSSVGSPTSAAAVAYLRCAGTTLAALVLLTVAGVAVCDPYLLLTDAADARRPFTDSFYLKKLAQSTARNPQVVFLGSSRTLLGLDPAQLREVRAYNFGIPGATALELEAATRHLLRWTDMQTLVLGVDYFMIDANREPPSGADAVALKTTRSLCETIGTMLVSWDAVHDCGRMLGLARRKRLPDWRADGFMEGQAEDAAGVDGHLAYMASQPPAQVSAQRVAMLDRLLANCQRQGVRVLLYIPPLHYRWQASEEARDGAGSYARFRATAAALAARHALPLWDFSYPSPVTNVPLVAANDFFLDASHFTPRVGSLVLRRLGFDVQPDPADLPLLAVFGTNTLERGPARLITAANPRSRRAAIGHVH